MAHEASQPLAAVVANAEACLRRLDSETHGPGTETPAAGHPRDFSGWTAALDSRALSIQDQPRAA
jgi:hypothetical protein